MIKNIFLKFFFLAIVSIMQVHQTHSMDLNERQNDELQNLKKRGTTDTENTQTLEKRPRLVNFHERREDQLTTLFYKTQDDNHYLNSGYFLTVHEDVIKYIFHLSSPLHTYPALCRRLEKIRFSLIHRYLLQFLSR